MQEVEGRCASLLVAEEGLELDGETYAVVDRFCYLGDMLSVHTRRGCCSSDREI